MDHKIGKHLVKYVPNYVVFDIETTGLSCKEDEVVEISAVKVEKGEIVDKFTSLVNPGIHIPYMASQVNGITNEMVKNSPGFDVVLKDFLEFIGDSILVGHNIHKFDLNFIYRDVEKYFGKTLDNDYVDTLPLAQMYLPDLDSHKLSDLAYHYGIESDGAHRALFDCEMNQRVYEKLGEEIKHPSEAAKKIKKCPRCGNIMRKRNGKFGEFWGCASYPDCKYTCNT